MGLPQARSKTIYLAILLKCSCSGLLQGLALANPAICHAFEPHLKKPIPAPVSARPASSFVAPCGAAALAASISLATSHKPQATSHKPQATSHKPQATSHKPQATSHKPQATSHKPQAHWPMQPCAFVCRGISDNAPAHGARFSQGLICCEHFFPLAPVFFQFACLVA